MKYPSRGVAITLVGACVITLAVAKPTLPLFVMVAVWLVYWLLYAFDPPGA